MRELGQTGEETPEPVEADYEMMFAREGSGYPEALRDAIFDENAPLNTPLFYEDENFLVIENRDFIKSAMKILTYEEKRFVISRYYRNMTQKDIAAKNGVSQMYVSRLERKVLEKLKKLYFE
jgi:RNA polymerase sigma-B factor